jgi:hypothetical protein
MIALLDGPQVDDGTAWEIGYFYAKKSPEQKIIGIRTDCRRAGESEGALVNAMIECSCDGIVRSREDFWKGFFVSPGEVSTQALPQLNSRLIRYHQGQRSRTEGPALTNWILLNYDLFLSYNFLHFRLISFLLFLVFSPRISGLLSIKTRYK